MAIEYGDILLNNDSKIYGTSDGDLATGNGKEQQVGAIVNATSGNFRRNPTLAANIAQDLDGPVDSRQMSSKIQNSLFLDGWVLRDLAITSDEKTTTIDILDAEKVTDDTKSLI